MKILALTLWLAALNNLSSCTGPGVQPDGPAANRPSTAPLTAAEGSRPWRAWGPLETLGGQTLDLDQVADQGRSVVLVFWQTWCAPCRQEAPALVAAAREFGDRAQFVGIVPGPDEVVDDAEVRDAIRDWGLVYPQVRDRNMLLSRTLHVSGTPSIFVLDPAGTVTYSGHDLPTDWAATLGG